MKYKPLQSLLEFQQLTNILKGENVRSYLEIGSKYGGSLWLMAEALPEKSLLVAVDLPHAPDDLASLKACVEEVKSRHQVYLFVGDSTDPAIVEGVKQLGPFDCCLIDANHTMPYIMKDWQNYGGMSRIVAFHDIGWKGPRPGKTTIEVPEFWNIVKRDYRHEEINLDPRDNGIGVLWR